MQVDCEVKNNGILKIEQVGMKVVESWLIKSIRHDLTIATWMSLVERKFKEDVVQDVFQFGISLRSHHPEFFAELLEICDRWDRYYRV